jgi:hypothetical protein
MVFPLSSWLSSATSCLAIEFAIACQEAKLPATPATAWKNEGIFSPSSSTDLTDVG